jgi:ADP-heptose:LPS heptosyltransferase
LELERYTHRSFCQIVFMKIIISPFSRPLRNSNPNAKDYPTDWWKKIISELSRNNHVLQVGVLGEEPIAKHVKFNASMEQLETEIKKHDLFISVDNFFPHMASHYDINGIVIWGKSDPNIFGYRKFTNLIKDRNNLRLNQFDVWEGVEYDENVFVSPETVLNAVNNFKS